MAKKPTIEKEKLASFSSGPVFALIIMLVIIIVGTLLAREYLLEPQNNKKKEEIEKKQNEEQVDIKSAEEYEYVEVLDDKIIFTMPEGRSRVLSGIGKTRNDQKLLTLEFLIGGFGDIVVNRQVNNTGFDQISINGQEIKVDNYLDAIGRFDENIFIYYFDGDLKSANLVIYNQDGEELFVYHQIKDDSFYVVENSFFSIDDKFAFSGTRLIDNNIYFDEQVISLCDSEKWQDFKDEPAIVRFGIDYQEKDFSKLEIFEVVSTIERSYRRADCE